MPRYSESTFRPPKKKMFAWDNELINAVPWQFFFFLIIIFSFTGIESFDSVLKPLWKGIRTHRGKGLAAFLKAIGYLIPLMDAEYANYYTKEVMLILIRGE